MAVFPPLIYGLGDSMPPNMLTLIVWRTVGFLKVPITMNFPMMPESFMILKRYLTTVTPTQGGGWVDDFGPAPSPITISGTFGYNTKGFFQGKGYNGFGWAKYLEWIVKISHETQPDGSLPEVWMMSHASQHFFEVELMDYNMSENVSRNMLWKYELKMTTLKEIEGVALIDPVLSLLDPTNFGTSIINELIGISL